MISSKRRGQPPSPPPQLPAIPISHHRSSFENFLDTSCSSLSSSASSSASLVTPIASTHHLPGNPRPQPLQPGYFDPTFNILDNSGEQTPTPHTQPTTSSSSQVASAQTTMLSHSRKRSGTAPENTPTSSTPGITVSRESPTTASSSTNNLNGSPSTPAKKEGSSKMKLFSSKPARIGTPPADKSKKPLPSPSKIPNISSPLPRIVNFHHDSSNRSESRSASRKGSFSNSTVTLTNVQGGSVPIDIAGLGLPQPAFASGATSLYSSSPPQSSSAKEGFHKSHFLRPKKDGHGLTLSSASSNSKFINADAQSIYSFGPSSPSGAAFAHQGKEGRGHHKHDGSRGEAELSGSGTDWQFVRKHVLQLFEGEALRTPVEEMNRAVSNHIQRCINYTSSVALIDDVRDLLDTGMLSIDPTLRSWPEEKLVPRLIEIWLFVFGNVLPYFEAVFLPLQQEFKGVGTIMTTREARDFWGALGVENGGIGILDVRRLALISFRDNIILPIHSRLRSIFMSTIHLDLTSDPHSTQTVARMLQCISVVAAVLSGDEHQSKIDELAKTLKHNWLGRGRAGRNRRGFVGLKMRAPVVSAASTGTGSPSGSVVGTPALGSPAIIYEGGKRDGFVGVKGLAIPDASGNVI